MNRFRPIWIGCIVIVGLLSASVVVACGGLFCQNVPVDQQAERIIFTMNGDGTVTAYVQINYVGEAPDFSWVVPVPSVPQVTVAEIATFDELSNLTAPIYAPPLMPACAVGLVPLSAVAEDGAVDDVTVLASGTAGPYAYDVITSPDPLALITWLRDNDYRITPEMEPLIEVYTNDGMVFLAMKLQPEQGVQDIQPVVMTYEADYPTIPIRLTAVAATPNMSIITWVFADAQVFPTNFAHPVIYDRDVRADFTTFDGTNYLSLVDQTVDVYQGRAFITEYARPTSDLRSLAPSDPLVRNLAERYRYVTRFFGRMSPDEMTVDPSFNYSDQRADIADVSNVHDLSQVNAEVFWGCPDADAQPIEIEFDPSVVPPSFYDGQ